MPLSKPTLTPPPVDKPSKYGNDPAAFDTAMQADINWIHDHWHTDSQAAVDYIEEKFTATGADAATVAASLSAASGYATAAGNSATAASGSAGTATTKAGEANASAIAAAASAVTATSRAGDSNASAIAAAASAASIAGGPVTSVNGLTGVVTIAVPAAASTTPSALGTAAVGTGTTFARADHVHQAQTSVTGNAATVTTNANLTGDVTSVGNATTLTNAPVIAKVLTGFVSGSGTVAATDSILAAIQKLNGNDALREATSNKDATGGYAGLTLYKINFKNAANTFTSFLTNANTAARTYTFKDADGTVAFTSDITGTNSGTNTGDNSVNSSAAPVAHVGASGTAHANVIAAGAAGFMTGSDKTKLDGIATGATANTGTVTGVTATAPVTSSGGTAPVISMAAATTSVSGYLTSTDWNTFNSKQPAGTYATGGGTATGTNTGDNAANTTYAADYRAANFVAGTNYQAPLVSGSNIRTVNGASLMGSTDLVISAPGLAYTTYSNRAALRTLSPAAGASYAVEGLGLFVWESASTEPDDDESCFATASGRWLLQAASWDLVDTWQAIDEAVQDEDDEDEPLRFATSFATSFATKILTGSATCAITSITAVNSASFTGTITGAAVGDRVIATPPAQLGSNATYTGALSHHAWVSADNTVTVMLGNASAATATTNVAIQTAWPITVIKT